jgi:hypothetical protein
MPMPPPENPAWGFVQWSLTGLATLLASGGAFLWRLMQRLERLESAQARQRIDIDASRSASEAALFRLGERLTQMHDDYFRLRETIGALPTRPELRGIGDHLAERLASLADSLRAQAREQVARRAHRPIVAYRDDANRGVNEQFASPQDLLVEFDDRPARPDEFGLDRQRIVHQRGRHVLDLQSAHCEKQSDLARQRLMIEPERAQPLRAPALEKTQVGGMVDATRKIRVFVIDAQIENALRANRVHDDLGVLKNLSLNSDARGA